MGVRDHTSAYLDGWFAHRNGLPVERCPYDERSMTRSYNQWVAGWCARFSALKHDHDLDLDAQLHD